MPLLQPIDFGGMQFNITDYEKYSRAIQLLKESLFDKGATLYASDNMITWNKNLSFLREDFYLDIIKDSKPTIIEKSTIWRTYILLYFAEIASKIDGDFVELGCHTGNSANNVIKKIDLKKLTKNYYLYDLFEWNEGDEHTKMEGHKNETMHQDVVNRFAEYPFIKVIKGSVPDSFSQGFPEKIAFAHIDMNHPTPEAGALERVLPRLSQGGIIIFDDYGWWGYSGQKIALDPIAKKHGLSILELPTGQALLIKS